jgi:hypothetical protein
MIQAVGPEFVDQVGKLDAFKLQVSTTLTHHHHAEGRRDSPPAMVTDSLWKKVMPTTAYEFKNKTLRHRTPKADQDAADKAAPLPEVPPEEKKRLDTFRTILRQMEEEEPAKKATKRTKKKAATPATASTAASSPASSLTTAAIQQAAAAANDAR